MYEPTLTPLRLARLRSGLPQYVLAKRAHFAASRLSVLERGYDAPTKWERAALARALGLPEEELFPVEAEVETPTNQGGAAHDAGVAKAGLP